MKLPYLNELETTRDMISAFKGYNHNLRIGDGEFYDMENLTSDNYPVLCTRQNRGVYIDGENGINGILGKDSLWYVQGKYIVHDGIKFDLGLDVNTKKTLIAMGAYIIVMPDKKYINTTVSEDKGSIENMPEMDFVCEAGNRLWGCKYGYNEKSEFLNEIYASKLGDFKNWSSFQGISTDSYIASVGTEGPFTGCINYMGYPIFFKENYMHKIYGDYPSNYQITTVPCSGVEKGSNKSLAIANGVLFYKSAEGICAYDGSTPQDLSYVFGGKRYDNAVSCAYNGKYYIALKSVEQLVNNSKNNFRVENVVYILKGVGEKDGDELLIHSNAVNKEVKENYSLFVYDTQKGLWHKEHCNKIVDMCAYDGNVYFVEDSGTSIFTIFESVEKHEKKVKWFAETGIINLQTPDRKYISKLNVSMALSYTAKVLLSIQYDSSGVWERIYNGYGSNLNTISIPIKPKRCDHFRIRFEGEGECKIYSIVKTIERGSDLK